MSFAICPGSPVSIIHNERFSFWFTVPELQVIASIPVWGDYSVGDTAKLRQQLKSLCASRRLSVLATECAGQPYSTLVVFAETDELRELVFVTSRRCFYTTCFPALGPGEVI